MKSWKTTLCGALALIGGALVQFYPEYSKLGGFLAFIGSGLGLLFARDNNVTSEQAGVDPASKAVKQFGDGPTPPRGMMLLLVAMLSLGCMATFTGCSTGPQTREAIVFNAYRDVWTVAHSAYQAHCENVVQGKVSKEKELKVDAAWNKFRLIFNAAVRATNHDWTQLPPASLDVAEAELLKLIRTL